MPVQLQSLLSGSSGNAVMISDQSTRLLIDCGVRAQYRCHDLLDRIAAEGPPLSGVIVSHLHTDHINYSSLRAIEERGIPVYVHRDNLDMLPRYHFKKRSFDVLDLHAYSDEPFRLGALEIRPIEVPHSNWHTTHSFVVSSKGNHSGRRIVVATDFYEWTHAVEKFVDADLFYLEANHDPEMLRRRPNPNSAFHLENSHAAALLCEILDRSRKPPKAVMLAHLSEERNTPEIALQTVRSVVEREGLDLPPLMVAPRNVPSEVVRLE